MPLSSMLDKKTARRLRTDLWTRHLFGLDAGILTQRDGAGNVELRGTVEGAVDVPARGGGKRAHRFDLQLGSGSDFGALL